MKLYDLVEIMCGDFKEVKVKAFMQNNKTQEVYPGIRHPIFPIHSLEFFINNYNTNRFYVRKYDTDTNYIYVAEVEEW